jgi:hypothetical protein
VSNNPLPPEKDAKVEYWALSEFFSKAILTGWFNPLGHVEAHHKHSGEHMLLEWDSRRRCWAEVDVVALYMAEWDG